MEGRLEKEAKASQTSANTPPKKSPIHDEWIFANNSNVFITNSKAHFTTFTDFKTHVGTMLGGDIDIVGIGDVVLDAKISATRKGRKSHQPLVLHDVLYAPNAVCNILGAPIIHQYHVTVSFADRAGRIEDRSTKKAVGLLEMGVAGLMRLKLKGQPGVGTRKTDQMFMINAHWPEEERKRWKLVCRLRDQYTDKEKGFLKERYKSEYHFLRMHALSIYKEEDRTEGRVILRAIMNMEGGYDTDEEECSEFDSDSESDDDDDDDDDADSFEEDMKANPMSHLADYHFCKAQLDCIKKAYGNSFNFLLSYGLKPYNDADCKEGVSIIEAMMRYDD